MAATGRSAGVSEAPGTLIIGDVHGCVDELDALVASVRPEHVVLVGDLFTKGPDPVGVWDRVRDGGWQAVRGNHDQRLIDYVDGARPSDRTAKRCVRALRRSGTAWLDALRALPYTLQIEGWTVVHAGLHPSGALDRTTHDMMLSMRRWPLDDPDAPHWHAQYTGTRRVVFGHDAVRGLVRVARDGAPLLVGLDTGCVYGGALSGYLPAHDRVVQIPARRVYRPVT